MQNYKKIHINRTLQQIKELTVKQWNKADVYV